MPSTVSHLTVDYYTFLVSCHIKIFQIFARNLCKVAKLKIHHFSCHFGSQATHDVRPFLMMITEHSFFSKKLIPCHFFNPYKYGTTEHKPLVWNHGFPALATEFWHIFRTQTIFESLIGQVFHRIYHYSVIILSYAR